MPAPVETDALRHALAALGVRAVAQPSPDGVAAALSFSLVGAAERQAMAAQHAAVAAGTIGDEDVARLTAETLGAAGCESELDALDLLRWRSSCLSRALDYIDVGGPWGVADPMMDAVVATASALAELMTAAHKMRDPLSGPADTEDAARQWWAAIASLASVANMSPVQSSGSGCGAENCDCDDPDDTHNHAH